MLTGFPHKIQNKMVSYVSPISIPLLRCQNICKWQKNHSRVMWFFHFSWLKSKGDLVNWWDLTRMVEIKRMVEKGRTENGNDSFVAFLSVPPNKSWTWRGIKYFFMKWWWWWIWNGGYSSSFLLFFFFFCPFWAQHFVSTAWAFNSRPW